MKWLQCLLEKWNETGPADQTKVRPVWFYPWKYDNKEDVRRGLISEVIINSIDVKTASTQTVINAAKQFGLFLGKSFLHVLASIKLKGQTSGGAGVTKIEAGAEVDLASIKEILTEYQQAAHPEKAYLNEFEDTLRKWVEDTIGKDRPERMVIFIDDLDRCMPEIALQVLEALKLYLNIPKLIFVVGVDKDVVSRLVVEHYRKLGLIQKKEKIEEKKDEDEHLKSETKARLYLSKMFQVEVELEPTEQQISDFFEKQLTKIPHWTDGLLDWEQEIFCDLVLKFVGRNPREVKRLLNSALMKGAGSELIKKDGIKFNQGLQLFFVRKILDERYIMASEAGSKRGIEFFVQWSQIVRNGKEKDDRFPLTVKVPVDFDKPFTEEPPDKDDDIVSTQPPTSRKIGDHLVDKGDGIFSHLKIQSRQTKTAQTNLSFAPREYHEFLKNQHFSGLLHLLADDDLGRLMQIEYPAEVEEVAAVVGTSKDADIIREALARQLKKKTDEVIDEDYIETRDLYLSGLGISDLALLRKFTNLQILELRSTQVTNVGPLAFLINLQVLDLLDTQVTNVDPLASLKNLQTLNLTGTQVVDVNLLASIKSLRLLGLGSTQIIDVSPLVTFENLQEIHLGDTQIIDVNPLASLKNLQTLYLNGTQVVDVSPLTLLKNLRWLDLSDTKVSDEQVVVLKKALPNCRIRR